MSAIEPAQVGNLDLDPFRQTSPPAEIYRACRYWLVAAAAVKPSILEHLRSAVPESERNPEVRAAILNWVAEENLLVPDPVSDQKIVELAYYQTQAWEGNHQPAGWHFDKTPHVEDFDLHHSFRFHAVPADGEEVDGDLGYLNSPENAHARLIGEVNDIRNKINDHFRPLTGRGSMSPHHFFWLALHRLEGRGYDRIAQLADVLDEKSKAGTAEFEGRWCKPGTKSTVQEGITRAIEHLGSTPGKHA